MIRTLTALFVVVSLAAGASSPCDAFVALRAKNQAAEYDAAVALLSSLNLAPVEVRVAADPRKSEEQDAEEARNFNDRAATIGNMVRQLKAKDPAWNKPSVIEYVTQLSTDDTFWRQYAKPRVAVSAAKRP